VSQRAEANDSAYSIRKGGVDVCPDFGLPILVERQQPVALKLGKVTHQCAVVAAVQGRISDMNAVVVKRPEYVQELRRHVLIEEKSNYATASSKSIARWMRRRFRP
jgi:hypothetical protein